MFPTTIRKPTAAAAVLAGACVLAVLAGALPFAGSWNDGSRLASVEALVDHGTFAIDRSIFVEVPQELVAAGLAPYGDDGANRTGTFDKLGIGGHFYSDKPALISLFMAVPYWIWQVLGGQVAAVRPDLFCLLMTWATSGVAFLVTVYGVMALARRYGLPPGTRLLLGASLGFGTVALVYTRQVNNHILLLGVMALVMLHLAAFGEEYAEGRTKTWRLLLLGGLAGIGFALDLGLGPILLVGLTGAVFFRTRSVPMTALFVVGTCPFVLAQMGLNHALGGVLKPINMVPEYLAWPGCPFNPKNMTGFLRHTPRDLVVYGLALLHGKHGFFGYNLPALLGLVAGVYAWRNLPRQRPEVGFALFWCVGGWLMYAVLSNNYGGICRSIRWFVPFLAPLFYLLVLLLRERPGFAWDLGVLTVWGTVLTLLLWSRGPWNNKVLIAYWPIQVLALASWWACRRWRNRLEGAEPIAPPAPAARAA